MTETNEVIPGDAVAKQLETLEHVNSGEKERYAGAGGGEKGIIAEREEESDTEDRLVKETENFETANTTVEAQSIPELQLGENDTAKPVITHAEAVVDEIDTQMPEKKSEAACDINEDENKSSVILKEQNVGIHDSSIGKVAENENNDTIQNTGEVGTNIADEETNDKMTCTTTDSLENSETKEKLTEDATVQKTTKIVTTASKTPAVAPCTTAIPPPLIKYAPKRITHLAPQRLCPIPPLPPSRVAISPYPTQPPPERRAAYSMPPPQPHSYGPTVYPPPQNQCFGQQATMYRPPNIYYQVKAPPAIRPPIAPPSHVLPPVVKPPHVHVSDFQKSNHYQQQNSFQRPAVLQPPAQPQPASHFPQHSGYQKAVPGAPPTPANHQSEYPYVINNVPAPATQPPAPLQEQYGQRIPQQPQFFKNTPPMPYSPPLQHYNPAPPTALDCGVYNMTPPPPVLNQYATMRPVQPPPEPRVVQNHHVVHNMAPPQMVSMPPPQAGTQPVAYSMPHTIQPPRPVYRATPPPAPNSHAVLGLIGSMSSQRSNSHSRPAGPRALPYGFPR